ncbi:MAG: SCO family protein [Planctomycetes bacterium]|nr:SCO family protein [Planctomycetota bacterium]
MYLKFIPSILVVSLFAACCCAQSRAQLEYELRGVDVVERIGDRIPTGLSFTDDDNRHVTLGQYLKPGRPLLISLNYSNCPRLCSYQLNDLSRALSQMEWTPGNEFVALTISIDPTEDYKQAKQTKLRYLGQVGKAEADHGWHFLTSGDESQVLALAKALGYSYRFDGESGEYRHKAAMFIVNGDGVISHYLRNLAYDPKDLTAQLKASADGKMGQPSTDASGFGLNCFAFEYTDNMSRAFNFMRIGGVGILLFLFSFVGYWWFRELRKPREAKVDDSVQPEAT